MNPTASPRHPWKALAVVLAMFVVVHGARAHVGAHPLAFTHVVISDSTAVHHDCPDVDVDDDVDREVDMDVDADDDELDDGPVINVFDVVDSDDWR